MKIEEIKAELEKIEKDLMSISSAMKQPGMIPQRWRELNGSYSEKNLRKLELQRKLSRD